MRTPESFIQYLPLWAFLLFGLASCDLEKDIEVPLPVLPSQMVVECYLENGKPLRLTLTESQSYFDDPQPIPITDAIVSITKNNGRPDTLKYEVYLDKQNQKVYTYRHPRLVNGRVGDTYTLLITDSKGRTITGQTQVLPPTPIDSLGWKFEEDKPIASAEAYLLTRFQDDPNQEDFYRLIINEDSLSGEEDINSQTSDNLRNGSKISWRTTYRYKQNDTLVVSLYHIEEAYYDFLISVDDAVSANSNPFSQPSLIQSTVKGGLGVFAHLNYDRRTIIVK